MKITIAHNIGLLLVLIFPGLAFAGAGTPVQNIPEPDIIAAAAGAAIALALLRRHYRK